MTKEQLKTKVEECFKNAENLLNKNGSLIPMLDVEFVDSNDKKTVIAVVLGDDDKQIRKRFIIGLGLCLGMIQQLGKIKKVDCIVMMSEVWFSTSSEQEHKMMGYRLPSENPQRKEGLIAAGMTADGTVILNMKEMFSIEVKGKRHFTLKDIEGTGEGMKEAQSDTLKNFFTGYEKALQNTEYNKAFVNTRKMFDGMDLDTMIRASIRSLTSVAGGGKLKSEIIKTNKNNNERK